VQVLSDKDLRARYDQFGEAGVKGQGAPNMQDFDLGDIFETFFGGQAGAGGQRRRSGPTEGDDLRFDLEIDFQTALFGGEKKIRITHLETCGTCTGSGVAPGAKVNSCTTCGGRGVVSQVVSTILGRMQQQVRCPTCGGTGTVVEKYCGSCDGKGVNKKSKQLTITIPPGVEDSNRLRVRGEGDAGSKGGPPGDLYVFLSVRPDPRFRREGMEIYSEVSVSYVDAILGSTLRVPTVDGTIDLQMPSGTQPGTTLRAEGKGAPKLNNVNVRGSHYVKVKVEIPQKLSNKERDLVTQLKEVTK
jgi:molecular chaperone DnaJ